MAGGPGDRPPSFFTNLNPQQSTGSACPAVVRWREEPGNLPSPQPSPSKLALASVHFSVAASASGCGWRGSPVAAVERAFLLPSASACDADTSSGKLSKASLRGEGQGEGRKRGSSRDQASGNSYADGPCPACRAGVTRRPICYKTAPSPANNGTASKA